MKAHRYHVVARTGSKSEKLTHEPVTLQEARDIGKHFGPRRPNAKIVAILAKRNPVKVRKNPSRRENVESAARRFADFTGHAATKELVFKEKPITTGLEVGRLVGVMYEATRDGKTEKYFHKFGQKSRPHLIASHDGNRLGIVGGRYRFTDRGIEDA